MYEEHIKKLFSKIDEDDNMSINKGSLPDEESDNWEDIV